MSLAGDTYGSSLLAAIGVTTLFADAADRYPEVTLDDVIAGSPDVVLAPSEPYSFRPEHLAELAGLAPVIEVDGQDLFWWGVRTPAAIHRLHQAIATC
jgi:ABC-type hemin transport system substrate-binding protein